MQAYASQDPCKVCEQPGFSISSSEDGEQRSHAEVVAFAEALKEYVASL